MKETAMDTTRDQTLVSRYRDITSRLSKLSDYDARIGLFFMMGFEHRSEHFMDGMEIYLNSFPRQEARDAE